MWFFTLFRMIEFFFGEWIDKFIYRIRGFLGRKDILRRVLFLIVVFFGFLVFVVFLVIFVRCDAIFKLRDYMYIEVERIN